MTVPVLYPFFSIHSFIAGSVDWGEKSGTEASKDFNSRRSLAESSFHPFLTAS